MMVHTFPQPPRSRLRRFALALAAVAHVLAVFVAPVAEAATERSMAPHAEEAGTSKHHSHTNSSCVICASHSLVASASPEIFRLTVASMRLAPPVELTHELAARATGAPVGSRAPPAIA
jgi:hypothetical protein